jgi:hypothetical protein
MSTGIWDVSRYFEIYPLLRDTYLLSEFEGFFILLGIYGQVALFGPWGSFGKGALFMYGGVVSKRLSCFGIGWIILLSLGVSIQIDEFITIPIALVDRVL